jgi:hypothetical protein
MSRHRTDDGGAVLVLAVLFVAVVGLIGGALVGFAGSSLDQTRSLDADRSQSYAAESAIQVAIANVRNLKGGGNAPGYSNGGAPNACPTTKVSIPQNGVNGAPTPEDIDVRCAVGKAPLPFERAITFAACPSGTSAGNCLTAGTDGFTPTAQGGAVVVVNTIYNDLKSGCSIFTSSSDNCFQPGTSVEVDNWDLTGSNG